jgi:hypothetical protein
MQQLKEALLGSGTAGGGPAQALIESDSTVFTKVSAELRWRYDAAF